MNLSEIVLHIIPIIISMILFIFINFNIMHIGDKNDKDKDDDKYYDPIVIVTYNDRAEEDMIIHVK